MNFFRPVAKFPAIAPVIFIAVFSPCTKNILAWETDIDAAIVTADPAFIWGAATLCASSHLQIVPSSRSFCQAFNFWDGRVTTLIYIYASPESSFFPFT